MDSYKTSKPFYKESAKLQLVFHELLDHLHLIARYWNKIRKAKKRSYEISDQNVEKSIERSKQSNGWMTNLFSTRPQSEANEDKLRRKDADLLRFYERSIADLKTLIQRLKVCNFEKSYIELLQTLNKRKTIIVLWLNF